MKSLVLVLLLCLVGCSSFNPVDMAKSVFSDDKGLEVDTELVVGDKEVSSEVQVGDRSKQEADNITNNIEEVPLWAILLSVIGWMAPSPALIWKEVKSLIGSLFNACLRLLPWVK